jgi:hypothetical protein
LIVNNAPLGMFFEIFSSPINCRTKPLMTQKPRRKAKPAGDSISAPSDTWSTVPTGQPTPARRVRVATPSWGRHPQTLTKTAWRPRSATPALPPPVVAAMSEKRQLKERCHRRIPLSEISHSTRLHRKTELTNSQKLIINRRSRRPFAPERTPIRRPDSEIGKVSMKSLSFAAP